MSDVTIVGRSDSYQVAGCVAETDAYLLYLCKQEKTGRECLLQIATDVGHNGDLDRFSYFLKELERRAREIEEQYEKVKKKATSMLNYHLGFPELVEGFVCHEQAGRRINILAFRNVPKVSSMIPLIGITEKDRLRVDLRTSVWMMGKLLKLLAFTHSEGITVGSLTGGNILIEPEQHYVLLFDWSVARVFPEGIPEDVRRQEISESAQAVITVLGGNPETGFIPHDDDKGFERYTAHILRLASGSERDAQRAHHNFYELVDEIWERGFHSFTTHPLTEEKES